ncbi:MAG TPA: hypothetical protein VF895_09960 [Gaiellaceae bacterium]
MRRLCLAGSYGQSAPAFTFDIGGKKGWTLCGLKVRASQLTGGKPGAGAKIADFQMNFSSRC